METPPVALGRILCTEDDPDSSDLLVIYWGTQDTTSQLQPAPNMH